MRRSAESVTVLLAKWREGDQEALQALIPLVYQELHRLAHNYLRAERAGHTLQSTALVHEAFLRLVDQTQVEYQIVPASWPWRRNSCANFGGLRTRPPRCQARSGIQD